MRRIDTLHRTCTNGLSLALLPDGGRFVTASDDRTAVLRTFKHHTSWVACLALLPDGLRFVSGSGDQTARIAYHGLAPQ